MSSSLARVVYFVSGHENITQAEFATEYAPLLEQAIDEGAAIVVGDARGTDAMAQSYFASRGYHKVTVYHMFDQARNNVGRFPTRGGFKSDRERDAAMTLASSRDIAWVRPDPQMRAMLGEEYREGYHTGTERNLIRRRRLLQGQFSPSRAEGSALAPRGRREEKKRRPLKIVVTYKDGAV